MVANDIKQKTIEIIRKLSHIVPYEEIEEYEHALYQAETHEKKQELLEAGYEWYKRESKEKTVDTDIFIDKEELKLKSKTQENLSTLKHQFIEEFSNYSFDNELAAEITYHVVLGICLRDIKIQHGAKNISLHTHLLWIQDSGSGKDEATEFLLLMINKLNEEIIKRNEGNPALDIKPILHMEFKESESDEALLDFYPKNKQGIYEPTKEKIHGIFSTYDLLYSREHSFLYQKKNRTKLEWLLAGLEGKDISKFIIGFQGRPTITTPNFAYFGTSRPVISMGKEVPESGFHPRALNVVREIQRDTRKKMNKKAGKSHHSRKTEWFKKSHERINNMAQDFIDIMLFYRKNILQPDSEEPEFIGQLIADTSDEMIDFIEETYQNKKHRIILNGFVGRFNSHIKVLAFHNAASRKATQTNTADYQNAINLIKKTFIGIRHWIEDVVDEVPQTLKDINYRQKLIENLFRNPEAKIHGIKKSMLKDILMKKCRVSNDRAYKIIQEFMRGPTPLLRHDITDGKINNRIVRLAQ